MSAFPFISEVLLDGVRVYLKVYGFILLVFPLYFELSVGSLFSYLDHNITIMFPSVAFSQDFVRWFLGFIYES